MNVYNQRPQRGLVNASSWLCVRPSSICRLRSLRLTEASTLCILDQ